MGSLSSYNYESMEFQEETQFKNPSMDELNLFNNNNSWPKNKLQKKKKKKKKKSQVFLQGYVETSSEDNDELGRTKSLTDEDLDELKGCLDLGFGFNYDEIPELCNTLPALKLCYSISQKYLDEHHNSKSLTSSPMALSETSSPLSGPIANWKISSPGDHPEDVKARLKFWAQAVACTVRLCNQKKDFFG